MSFSTSYKVVAVVLALLNVFLVILVGITAHFKAQEKRSYSAKARFCVPCHDILGHPDDGLPYGVVPYNNNTKCCTNYESGLTDLVRASTVVYQDRKFHEENLTITRCNIQTEDPKPLLKLRLSDAQMQGDAMELHWEKDFERQSDKSLQYADGKVTIGYTGLYHVYTQVAFQYQENVTPHPEFPKQHIIGFQPVGSSERHYRYIAKGSDTQCKFHSKNGKHFSTSFIGTVYRLQKGDRVSVRVHDQTQLLQEKHMNFFGIHMV